MRNRTYAAALLVLAFILAYADRLAINVLLPSIKSSFHLSLFQASLLVGFAFSLFFAIAGIPLGLLADRVNRRNLLAVGIALWSLATMASGLSTSFAHLFAARIVVGIGEACLLPTAASLLADYYPPEQRGRAIAFTQAGTPMGSLLGTMGAGWLLTWLDATHLPARLGWGLENWNICFLVLGAPGLILATALMTIKEPARREIADTGRASGQGAIALFRRHPVGFSAFTLSYALAGGMLYSILGWAPTIYVNAYHLSAGAAGTLVGGMLLLGSVTAYFITGVSSDILMRWRPLNGRVLVSGLALPICLVASVCLRFTPSVATTTLALFLGMFMGTIASAGALPALQAITPNRLRGRVVAAFYLVVNMVGLGVMPSLVALAAQLEGGEGALQRGLATVCVGTSLLGLILWPVVMKTYAGMRNYEADEVADPELVAPDLAVAGR